MQEVERNSVHHVKLYRRNNPPPPHTHSKSIILLVLTVLEVTKVLFLPLSDMYLGYAK